LIGRKPKSNPIPTHKNYTGFEMELTQEQKDILDRQMKDYRKRTGRHLNSVCKLPTPIYDLVFTINPFETIYQAINMYLWDCTHKSKSPKVYTGSSIVTE